jgi:hypothetical protein
MFDAKNQWQEWARQWGLVHVPNKGPYRNEAVAGRRGKTLVRVRWTGEKGIHLNILVRYPASQDAERLRDTLIADASLDVLPDKGKKRPKMKVGVPTVPSIQWTEPDEFRIGSGVLSWTRAFRWRGPKPDEIQAWVDALVGAIVRATGGVDDRCEGCGQPGEFVLVNDAPLVMCATCQQRRIADGEMAERAYDMSEAQYARGAVSAIVAALLGALAWAGIAIATQRMFALLAIGIGAFVGWAYRQGAGKVDKLGMLVAGALTLIAVQLGDILFYTALVAKQQPAAGFNLDYGLYVYVRLWATAPGEQVLSVLFALVGVWTASRVLRRNSAKPVILRAGDPPSARAA